MSKHSYHFSLHTRVVIIFFSKSKIVQLKVYQHFLSENKGKSINNMRDKH